MYESYLLALVALVMFYFPLLLINKLSKTRNSRLLTFGYFAGGSFYIILPSYMPIILGEQIINFTYSYDAYFGSEILNKVYLILITYSLFSLIGFFIGYSLIRSGKNLRKSLPEKYHTSYLLVVFILSLLFSWLITLNGMAQGVATTGERGQGLPIILVLVVNSFLLVSMALLMDKLKSNRNKIIVLVAVLLLFLTQSVLVAGSRRIVAFFILFVLVPMLLRIKVVGKFFVLLTVPLVIFTVIIYGVLRKSLHLFDGTSSFMLEIPNVVAELKSNIQLLLMNADFAIVFDAFIGVIKNVPDKVDYLYGDTFLKLFYFPIPRSIWPDKPHTISVVVTDKIYNMDSNAVSFNPNLFGEMYFNGGYIVVSIVSLFVGVALGFAYKYANRLNDVKISYTVFFGIVSMSFFNLWRGYTFEIILNLLFLAFSFYVIKNIGKVKLIQKRIAR